MDINKNQQTNTFLKGMNTDTSDFLLSDEQYRYAENVRLTTDLDNNQGELHVVNGISRILQNGGTILAFASIRNYIAYVIKNEDQSWSIYRYVAGSGGAELVFGPCKTHPIWNENEEPNVNVVLRWESDKNIKLYIATGVYKILSINIYKTDQGSNFENIFGYNVSNIYKITATVSNSGGSISAARVQYVYRLYSDNMPASTISAPSNIVSLYDGLYRGFKKDETTNKSVNIHIDNISNFSNYNIQIYRISYKELGQPTTVNLIFDQSLENIQDTFEFVDIGQNLKEISQTELLALIKLDIIPCEIESKGDYLFAGNIKYQVDQLDEKLQNFDTRTYSKGNYVIIDDVETPIVNNNGTIIDVGDKEIRHHDFDGGIPTWKDENWGKIGNSTYNGIGPNIKWKYTYINRNDSGDPVFNSQDRSHTTYRDGDVYRFGIRFFSIDGTVSSVKWMCDILMHGELDNNTLSYIGVQFDVTIPQQYDFIYGYEIVRCNRTIDDRYIISQGITGFPFKSKNGILTNPGLFSHQNIRVSDKMPAYNEADEVYVVSSLGHVTELTDKYTMFASPECCYQPDDIDEILKSNPSAFLKPLYSRSISDANSTHFVAGEYADDENIPHLGIAPNGHLIPETRSEMQNPFKFYRSHSSFYQDHAELNGLWFMSRERSDIENVPVKDDCYYHTASSALIATQGFVKRGEYQFPMSLPDSNIFNPNEYNIHSDDPRRCVFNKVDSDSSEINKITDEKERSISAYATVKSPKWDSFIKDGQFNFGTDSSFVGDATFINWTLPLLCDFEQNGSVLSSFKRYHNYESDDGTVEWDFAVDYNTESDKGFMSAICAYPISTGGSLCLFKTGNEENTLFRRPATYNGTTSSTPQIYVENLIKPATPYGGYNKAALKNSVYYSYGNFYTCQSGNTYQHEVWDGDCRIQNFIYHASHFMFDANYMKCTTRMFSVYVVPIETEIDLTASSGTLYFRDTQNYHVQDYAEDFDNYIQTSPAYEYNTAYSAQPNVIPISTDVSTKAESDTYDSRICYSEKKDNNELIDSWTQISMANYIDVDSRFGEITQLKLFKDKLLFWQTDACGVLSVNERTLLNTVDSSQIILGTGDVLQRYDYISQIHGQKKGQHTACVTDQYIYWWDGHNKEIVRYNEGYSVTELALQKTIKNYIKSKNENTKPCIFNDPLRKEVVCSVVGEQSVVFDEKIDQFVSIYTLAPHYSASIHNDVYITNNTDVYEYDKDTQTWFGGSAILPKINFIVNKSADYNKTFDVQTFGGRFYGGSTILAQNRIGEFKNLVAGEHTNEPFEAITFKYNTPLKQYAEANGKDIVTNSEYDFRLNVPRNGNNKNYGDRLRGKIMQCEISSSSKSDDFSLQYVTTKYRMSWT